MPDQPTRAPIEIVQYGDGPITEKELNLLFCGKIPAEAAMLLLCGGARPVRELRAQLHEMAIPKPVRVEDVLIQIYEQTAGQHPGEKQMAALKGAFAFGYQQAGGDITKIAK